jgi:hypothetical protein
LLELIKHEQEPIERRKGFNIIDGGNKWPIMSIN